jgi:hypothetical protein
MIFSRRAVNRLPFFISLKCCAIENSFFLKTSPRIIGRISNSNRVSRLFFSGYANGVIEKKRSKFFSKGKKQRRSGCAARRLWRQNNELKIAGERSKMLIADRVKI